MYIFFLRYNPRNRSIERRAYLFSSKTLFQRRFARKEIVSRCSEKNLIIFNDGTINFKLFSENERTKRNLLKRLDFTFNQITIFL